MRFTQFVFSMLFEGATKTSPADRQQLIEGLAQALDAANGDEVVNRAVQGVGPCNIRLPLLAMMPSSGPALLPWTELPQPESRTALLINSFVRSSRHWTKRCRSTASISLAFPRATSLDAGTSCRTAGSLLPWNQLLGRANRSVRKQCPGDRHALPSRPARHELGAAHVQNNDTTATGRARCGS